MLDGKGRRHGQHNTGFNTKKKRKEGVLLQYIMGTNKNAIKNIATKEDWKNASNGRVAYQLIMMVKNKKRGEGGSDSKCSAMPCALRCYFSSTYSSLTIH